MIDEAFILNKVYGVTHGQRMTSFANIKTKMGNGSHYVSIFPIISESVHAKLSCVT